MFFKKTVDSILADITAKIESLHIVADAHTLAASGHAMEIEYRTKLKADAEAEAKRARNVAAKFLDLVS